VCEEEKRTLVANSPIDDGSGSTHTIRKKGCSDLKRLMEAMNVEAIVGG